MQSRAAQERRRELNTFDLSEITRGDLINMIVEPSEPSYRRTEQGTIQHGGFCVVVKAWDDTKQKALAIKILNSMITNVDAWRPYLVDLRSMQPVLHEQPYLQHWHEAQAHKADETTTTWPWARPPMGCQRPALGHPPRWSASARPRGLHPLILIPAASRCRRNTVLVYVKNQQILMRY